MTRRVKAAVAGNQHVPMQAPKWDYANGEKKTATGTSSQTAAISSTLVRMYATADMLIKIGTNPTASDASGSMVLEAGTTYHETIDYGDKIAIIELTGGGDFYMVPAELEDS